MQESIYIFYTAVRYDDIARCNGDVEGMIRIISKQAQHVEAVLAVVLRMGTGDLLFLGEATTENITSRAEDMAFFDEYVSTAKSKGATSSVQFAVTDSDIAIRKARYTVIAGIEATVPYTNIFAVGDMDPVMTCQHCNVRKI